jgi:hypothetical protein
MTAVSRNTRAAIVAEDVDCEELKSTLSDFRKPSP